LHWSTGHAAALAVGRINAVNLEHVLGGIKTNRGNLHVTYQTVVDMLAAA
jgi:hypothetical protein